MKKVLSSVHFLKEHCEFLVEFCQKAAELVCCVCVVSLCCCCVFMYCVFCLRSCIETWRDTMLYPFFLFINNTNQTKEKLTYIRYSGKGKSQTIRDFVTTDHHLLLQGLPLSSLFVSLSVSFVRASLWLTFSFPSLPPLPSPPLPFFQFTENFTMALSFLKLCSKKRASFTTLFFENQSDGISSPPSNVIRRLLTVLGTVGITEKSLGWLSPSFHLFSPFFSHFLFFFFR